MSIKAADVAKLRKATGAGMMDCKKALTEAEGDFDSAVEIIRKKGMAIANKRADREATEGVVLAKVSEDKKNGAMITLNCETDFVAKNEDFVSYVNSIVDLAVANKAKNADELNALDLNGRTVGETIIDQTGVIGEKIELGAFEVLEADHVTAYVHQGNRLATVLGLNKAGFDTAGKDLAMQVAAMNPLAVDKDQIDPKVIEREKEIGMDQARQEGKKEELLEKIAMGKLNKFFKENTLINQDFVKESKKSVKQYLSETDKDLTVTDFKRVMLASL
jgi:elongation factor Ts